MRERTKHDVSKYERRLAIVDILRYYGVDANTKWSHVQLKDAIDRLLPTIFNPKHEAKLRAFRGAE